MSYFSVDLRDRIIAETIKRRQASPCCRFSASSLTSTADVIRF